MTQPSAELKARILASVQAAPSPARGSGASPWLVLPSGALVAAALFFAFHGIEHGSGRPTWFYVACVTGWAAVAGLSVFGALGRDPSSSWRSRQALLAVAIGTPSLLLALMFGAALAWPEVAHARPAPLGVRCFGLTLAAAAFPLIALLRLRRGSDPVHPALTGAALGSACGAAAGVMVEQWCPVASVLHVALGHVLPLVVLAAVGAGLGARILSPGGAR